MNMDMYFRCNKYVIIISMHKYYTCLIVSLLCSLTLAIDESEHNVNLSSVLQINYKMLTEKVNPCRILHFLLRKDVITTEEMLDINKIIEKEGAEVACEKMVSVLSAGWTSDSLSKITATLDDCGYTECATALRGKIPP